MNPSDHDPGPAGPRGGTAWGGDAPWGGTDSSADAPPPLPDYDAGPEQLARVPWRWWEPIVVFVFTIVSSTVLGFLATFLLTLGADCGAERTPGRCDVGDAVFIAIFEIALGAWALLWVKVRWNTGPRSLGLSADRLQSNLGVGLVTGIVGFIAGPVIIGTLAQFIVDAVSDGPVKAPEQLPFGDAPHWGALLITGLSVVVLAPIAEEMFFRGFLYQGLRRKLAVVPAGIVSALIFGAAHIQPGAVLGLLLLIPAITVLGFILAWVFERRSSLVPSITAHALFNLVGFSLYLVSLAAE